MAIILQQAIVDDGLTALEAAFTAGTTTLSYYGGAVGNTASDSGMFREFTSADIARVNGAGTVTFASTLAPTGAMSSSAVVALTWAQLIAADATIFIDMTATEAGNGGEMIVDDVNPAIGTIPGDVSLVITDPLN